MNNKPLVSIIVNCYNSEEYLKEAIDSVIKQTYDNWELIFWDNQSSDSSAEIVNKYADSRIKYYYAPAHTSLGEGRNLALEKVSGEFVSFLDADDLYSQDRLEILLTYFNDNIKFVYTNGYRLNQDNGKKTAFYTEIQRSGTVFEFWIDRYNVMIPSVMFRTSLLDTLESWVDNRFSMIEEYDFFLRMVQHTQVAYCDERLCTWRCHSKSLTWNQSKKWGEELKLFKSKISIIYPQVKSSSLELIDRKVAISDYIDGLNNRQNKRGLLRPYIAKSLKFLMLFLLSYSGTSFTRCCVLRKIK